MVWSNTAILAILELVIYILFVPFTLFTAFRHGRRGSLGHTYLFIFITLRLVADELEISTQKKPASNSTAGAIVNSIGLSPLLLSTIAILNESRSYLQGRESTRAEKIKKIALEVAMHQLVIAGLALLATGSSQVATATTPSQLNRSHTLAKVGAILLLISWIICCVWTLLNIRLGKQTGMTGPTRKLLAAVVILLPFLGARVLYAVVYAFDTTERLSPATASFAIKFCLVFLVQLIVALAIQAGFFFSRNIARAAFDRVGNAKRITRSSGESDTEMHVSQGVK